MRLPTTLKRSSIATKQLKSFPSLLNNSKISLSSGVETFGMSSFSSRSLHIARVRANALPWRHDKSVAGWKRTLHHHGFGGANHGKFINSWQTSGGNVFSTSSKQHDQETKPASVDTPANKKKPGKIAVAMKEYGVPFLVWWTAVWAGTGVSIYFALDSGVVASADIIKWIISHGLDQWISPESINPKYGNLLIAVAVNEAIEPVRFPICLATMPLVKRMLGKKKEEATTNGAATAVGAPTPTEEPSK